MTAHSSQVHVTVLDQDTSEVLRTLGPYVTAAAARTNCGMVTGQILVWTRHELDQVAELDGTKCRAPADSSLEA